MTTPEKSPEKKDRSTRMAVFGLTAGLLGGSLAGAALGVPGLAGAAETATATAAGAGGWVRDTLSQLVTDGTLTQEQADAVAGALEENRPARPGPGPRGGFHLETAAEALGVTVDELRQALRDGQSLADVAAARGVDAQSVIDALVAEAREKLADGVADGRITQEQADARLAEATEHITAMVNGELPPPGPRGPRGPHRGAPPAAEGTGDAGS